MLPSFLSIPTEEEEKWWHATRGQVGWGLCSWFQVGGSFHQKQVSLLFRTAETGAETASWSVSSKSRSVAGLSCFYKSITAESPPLILTNLFIFSSYSLPPWLSLQRSIQTKDGFCFRKRKKRTIYEPWMSTKQILSKKCHGTSEGRKTKSKCFSSSCSVLVWGRLLVEGWQWYEWMEPSLSTSTLYCDYKLAWHQMTQLFLCCSESALSNTELFCSWYKAAKTNFRSKRETSRSCLAGDKGQKTVLIDWDAVLKAFRKETWIGPTMGSVRRRRQNFVQNSICE